MGRDSNEHRFQEKWYRAHSGREGSRGSDTSLCELGPPTALGDAWRVQLIGCCSPRPLMKRTSGKADVLQERPPRCCSWPNVCLPPFPGSCSPIVLGGNKGFGSVPGSSHAALTLVTCSHPRAEHRVNPGHLLWGFMPQCGGSPPACGARV